MLLGIDSWKDYRSEIIKMINELEGGSMVWLDENTASHFISSVKFSNNGLILFEFPEALREHVGMVSTTYSKYQLGTILPLKSAYSLRFYELMKKDAHKKRVEYPIETLYELLDVPPGKYQLVGHFVKRILSRAVSEVNLKTDLQIEFFPMKKAKSKEYIGFQFDIKINSKDLKEYAETVREAIRTGAQTVKEFSVPDAALNSPAFNNVYENFVKHINNFPEGYTFDTYLSEHGFKMQQNNRGGRDILIQTKFDF